MSEVLYPDGYNSPPRMVPIETVFARASVMMLHSEYQKRWRGLMIAGEGRLGIGGAGRSSEQQTRVFLERHNKVTSGGCCYYNGYRYQLKTGQAHAAPPGNSFHEDVVHGYAAAVDAIGDLKWAALNCERYGLEQADWGGEVWHFQFTEFPRSVSAWRKQGSPPPQKWVLPGDPSTPPPKPPEVLATPPGSPSFRQGATDASTKMAGAPDGRVTWWQTILRDEYVSTIVPDGQFGAKTDAATKTAQGALKVTVDGIYGNQTAAARYAKVGK